MFQQLLFITSCKTNNIFDCTEVFIQSSIFPNKILTRRFLLAGLYHTSQSSLLWHLFRLPCVCKQSYRILLFSFSCRWVTTETQRGCWPGGSVWGYAQAAVGRTKGQNSSPAPGMGVTKKQNTSSSFLLRSLKNSPCKTHSLSWVWNLLKDIVLGTCPTQLNSHRLTDSQLHIQACKIGNKHRVP